jgi:translocator protein
VETLRLLLALLFALVGIGCAVVILIDAFKDAVWKGLVALLCGCYMLYYAFFEFDHEHKWLILLGWVGGAVASGIIAPGTIGAR